MTARQRTLLGRLVEGYIQTQQPVPSSVLAREMDLSPATVRYELIELEQANLVAKPHTSAGRVPTRQGFRFYALSLLPPAPLASHLFERLARVLEEAGSRREHLVVQVAARLSGYPALLRTRPLNRPRLVQVHLSLLEGGKVLAVAVLEGGRVREARLELDFSPSEALLTEAETLLRGSFTPQELPAPANPRLYELFQALSRAFSAHNLEEYREGMGLLLSEPEAQDPQFVRRALERYETPSDEPLTPAGGLNLRVGEDSGLSLVQVGVAVGGVVGELSLLGPLRMRYSQALSVAQALSQAYMGKSHAS